MLVAVLAGALLAACGGGDAAGGTDEPVAITTQPASVTAAPLTTAIFTVQARGTSPSYQWQRSANGGAGWADLAGQRTAAYALVSDQAFNGWQFRVIVSNSVNSVTSAAATLTVPGAGSAPVITQQPANQTVTAPATATFTVAAAGIPEPDLQWQASTDGGVTFSDIAGADAASYATPATAVADSGRRYRVVVSNGAGTVTSNVTTLTVNAATGGGGGGGGASSVPAECVPANVLPAGMVLESAWTLEGSAGSAPSATLTVVGPSTFQGGAAFETRVNSTLAFFPTVTRTFSSYDPTSRVLTPLGAILRLGADPANYTEITSVPRQPVRYPVYALAAGQQETVTTTADNTSVTVVNGVAGAPTTATETTTTTYTFHGTETLTVPAGTFLTCRHTEQVAGGGTSTNWLMVGYGVNVRTVSTSATGNRTTQTLTSMRVNGVALTRFP